MPGHGYIIIIAMFWALSQTSLGRYDGILPGHNPRQTLLICACYLAWLRVREVVT
jgi:hypothetical protein